MMLNAIEEEEKQNKGHSAIEWVETAEILNEMVSFKGKWSPKM